MRTGKYTLLILSVALTFISCGGNKEVPDAADQMKKHKLVRIGTDAVNLPFEFGSGTGVQGLDVDIGDEIGKDLGYETKWIKISPFEHLFDILKNGEVEFIISAISPTPDRNQDFAFSKPYFDGGNTIARRKVSTEIKDLASLSGKKVGVEGGRMGDQYMATQKVATNVSITKYPTLDDALGALNRTEIDAVVGDEPILTYSMFKSFRNLIPVEKMLTHEQYVVVVRKGEKQLLAKINATLDRLKTSGEIEALHKKWFQDVEILVKNERDQLAQEETLKKSPKAVTCNITKTGGAFSMDRLDGFQLVLEGPGGRFQSTPILTNGNKGNCKFNEPIPPGDYKLNMSIFKMTVAVPIPGNPSRSITLDMNIGASGIAITPK